MSGLTDKIRRGEPLPWWAGVPLRMLEPLTRAGMAYRLRQPRTRVSARVISFGNITAGGTGKTPAVIARAEQELAQGRRVAVLTRGYGAEKGPEPLVIDGNKDAAIWRKIGDEAALILRRVPGVTVVKSANRVSGAQAAIAQGCNTLILDDGYQYVMLERDENILVIDATNPFGNGHLLPRGILREPLSAVQRATQVILTRCDQAPEVDAVEREVRRWLPEVPLRRTRHAPTRFWRVADGASRSLESLRGERAVAACAIGHPEAFFQTLTGLSIEVVSKRAYPDHAPVRAEELPRDEPVIVTEKDAVRLSGAGDNVYALGVDLQDI